MRLRAALAILRKDLLLFFGDRRAVVITMVTPIAIAAFFGFIFSGSGSSEQAKIEVRAADLDASSLTAEILRALSADKTVEVKAATPEEARQAVRTGKASVGLVFPKGFGDAAARALFGGGTKPEIQFLYDPSRSAEMAMVRGILTQHIMEVVSRQVFTGEQGRAVTKESLKNLDAATGMDPKDKDVLRNLLTGLDQWQERQATSKKEGKALPAQGFTMPYQVKEEAVTGREGVAYNGYAHSFSGMGIQFILFAAIELGVGVLQERRMGIWRRLRSAPVTKGEVVLGKALSGAAIAGLTLAVTMGAGIAFFGVRVSGSLAGFMLLCAASACMASAFGLMIAAFGKTVQAARGIAIFAVLLLTMLGGGWVPAFIFPGWLQTFTLAVPTRWAMDGLDAVTWRGGEFGAALLPACVLLGFTAAFGLIAAFRFPWDEGV
jgi:ABC-2 type transport system permease protein